MERFTAHEARLTAEGKGKQIDETVRWWYAHNIRFVRLKAIDGLHRSKFRFSDVPSIDAKVARLLREDGYMVTGNNGITMIKWD